MSINIPTWKNVEGPDYSSANWLGAQASKSMRQGFQDLSGAFRDQAEIGRDTLTGEAMAQLSQLDDINTFDQDKANLLGGIDMGNIHQDKFMDALMSRRDTLDSRDASAYERKYRDQIMGLKLAGLQRSASGGGGRGGGGSGGGGGMSFGGLKGDKAMYAAVGQAAIFDESGNFNAAATQKKLLDAGHTWAHNPYYLSNYNKNHIGSRPELGMRNSLREASLKKDMEENGKKGTGSASAKDYYVGRGPDSPDASMWNLKGRAKNSSHYNTRLDDMEQGGATKEEMRGFEAESIDFITGSLDSTDGAADAIYNNVMNRAKIGKVDLDDPVATRFLKEM